jgi:hypothetical protein
VQRGALTRDEMGGGRCSGGAKWPTDSAAVGGAAKEGATAGAAAVSHETVTVGVQVHWGVGVGALQVCVAAMGWLGPTVQHTVADAGAGGSLVAAAVGHMVSTIMAGPLHCEAAHTPPVLVNNGCYKITILYKDVYLYTHLVCCLV